MYVLYVYLICILFKQSRVKPFLSGFLRAAELHVLSTAREALTEIDGQIGACVMCRVDENEWTFLCM